MPDISTKLSLTDLAAIAFTETMETAEKKADEMFIRHRAEFLGFADGRARRALGGEAADQLIWQYTGTMHLPKGVEEATARIDGGPNYLRYRVADEDATLQLVQPCSTCGHDQINPVDSLATLGGLLEMGMDRAAVA